MANKNRARLCLLVGTALILLAASSRASHQSEALRVRLSPEEEQHRQPQEAFEEELIEAAVNPPSSKEYSIQVWEGVIKQEATALKSPSQSTDNETSTMSHVKKNKRKKNQKKGARMGALKVAHKGRRHRHRGQKKEKVLIRNANAAQDPPPPPPLQPTFQHSILPVVVQPPKPVKEVKPPILISTPQPQPPVTSIAPIAPPPVIPPPLAIPASEPTTPKTVESPPPEILKPLENENATDKNGKDKAKVNLSPTKTALAPLVVTEIGKKTEGVVKNVEGSHANVLPTIAPVTPFQTPVAETVDGETRNKGSDKDIDGTIDTAPVITTPTATVPAPERVHSAATEAEKTVEDTAKGIKDPVNPAVPVQILTVAPNIAAPTQTIIKAIGDAAKSVHDGSFLLPTAIPISNAIDDLFGGTTPTLGIIFRTQVDDQHEAPTPVLRMPIETTSPSNPREQDRQKRPSPADDDKKDLEDDKKKTKDTTDNETEDEEEEEEKNTEDTTDNDTEDEEEEKEKKTKDTTDNDTEDEEEEKEKKTKDTTDNDTEDEEEEEGKKTGEHHPKDRLKGDREEDEPTEDEGPDGPADGDKAPVPDDDDDDDDEGTEEQKEGAHKESKVSPQDSDRVVLDDDGNFVSTQHQALARGTFKAEEKERNNHESDDEENDDEEKSCQPKNKDDIENSTVEKASDKDDSHQDDNVDKKKETKKKTKLHRTTKAHRRPFSSLREVLLKLEMEEAAGLLDPENSDYNISDDIPQENLQAITDHQAAIASTDQDLPLSALRHPPTPEEIKDTEHQGADAFFELLAPEIVLNRKVAQASDREKSEEDKGTTIDTKKEKKSKGKQKKKAKKENKGKKDKKAEKKGKKNNNHTKSKQRKKDKINALEKRQIPAAPAPIPVAVVGATPVAPLADPQRPPEAPVAQVDDKKMHKDKKVDKVENAADIGFVTQEDMSMIFDLDDGIFPVEDDDDDDDDEDDDEDEDDDVYFADNADNSQESGLIGAKKHKKGRNGKAVDSIGVMEETEDDKNAGRKDKGMKDKGSEKKDTKSKEINNNKPVHQPHVKQPQQGNAKGGPPGRGEPATPAGAAPAAGGNSVAGGNGAPGYGTVPMFGLSRLDLSNAARSIRGSVLKTVFAAVMVVLVVVM